MSKDTTAHYDVKNRCDVKTYRFLNHEIKGLLNCQKIQTRGLKPLRISICHKDFKDSSHSVHFVFDMNPFLLIWKLFPFFLSLFFLNHFYLYSSFLDSNSKDSVFPYKAVRRLTRCLSDSDQRTSLFQPTLILLPSQPFPAWPKLLMMVQKAITRCNGGGWWWCRRWRTFAYEWLHLWAATTVLDFAAFH